MDRKVVVEQVIEFEPGLDSFSDRLMDVKGAQARVFLMYARYLCEGLILLNNACLLSRHKPLTSNKQTLLRTENIYSTQTKYNKHLIKEKGNITS